MRRTRAFTLVELLIVIGIIAALIAILLPALNKAREQARNVTCQSNQRQILMAMRMYADENQGWLPITQESHGGFGNEPGQYYAIWMADIGQYDWTNGSLWPYMTKDVLSRQTVFNCPSDDGSQRFAGDTTGAVDAAHVRNFSYNFNPDLAAVQLVTHRMGVKLNQVLHPEHKLLVLEMQYPRSTVGQLNAIRKGTQGTGAQIGELGVFPLLTPRHSGFANAGMADGHVEQIDGTVFTGTALENSYEKSLSIGSASYSHYVTLTDWR